MTEQVEYVQKRLDLLDPSKLNYMQIRTKALSDELQALSQAPHEVRDLSHDREEVFPPI